MKFSSIYQEQTHKTTFSKNRA